MIGSDLHHADKALCKCFGDSVVLLQVLVKESQCALFEALSERTGQVCSVSLNSQTSPFPIGQDPSLSAMKPAHTLNTPANAAPVANMSQVHPIPPFPPGVRFARPNDIVRAAYTIYAAENPLGTSCAQYSSTPRQQRFEAEMIRHQAQKFECYLQHPHCIVLVAEDEFDAEEYKYTDIGEFQFASDGPDKGDEVVVGVAVYGIESGQPHALAKTFAIEKQETDGSWPDLGELTKGNANRIYPPAVCDSDMTLAYLYVHPAYQKRGHGAKLVRWGQEYLVSQNLKKLDLAALPPGIPLYRKMGFTVEEGEDDNHDINGTTPMEWLAEYKKANQDADNQD